MQAPEALAVSVGYLFVTLSPPPKGSESPDNLIRASASAHVHDTSASARSENSQCDDSNPDGALNSTQASHAKEQFACRLSTSAIIAILDSFNLSPTVPIVEGIVQILSRQNERNVYMDSFMAYRSRRLEDEKVSTQQLYEMFKDRIENEHTKRVMQWLQASEMLEHQAELQVTVYVIRVVCM